MARDAQETKRRIYEAATAEFTTHGIAGARIDRIAAAAGANKQLIYAYFGNKRELFEAVVSEHVGRLLADVPFDPHDLPGHASAMFDFYSRHPEVGQLGAWHALEPGEKDHQIPLIRDTIKERTRAVAQAQAAGSLDSTIRAEELLALIWAIARTWAVSTPERAHETASGSARTAAARRAAVGETVARMVKPVD